MTETLHQHQEISSSSLQPLLLTHLSPLFNPNIPCSKCAIQLAHVEQFFAFLLAKAFTNLGIYIPLQFSFPAAVQSSPVHHAVSAFEHLCSSHPY